MGTFKKNIIQALAIAGISSSLIACGGGGGDSTGSGGTYIPPVSGGGSTSPTPSPSQPYTPVPSIPSNGTYYSHNEIAAEFAKRLNTEVSGYQVSLVKTNTLQASYIVVYDNSYRTYDAYYVGSYTPGQDLALYLNKNESSFYYDLVSLGNNNYKDFVTGRLFEIEDSASMNVEKVAAYQELAVVQKTALKLREVYGMSEESSLDTARFAVRLNNNHGGAVDKVAMDRFAAKLTGSTVTQFQNDIKAGNQSSLQHRIELAKEKTGMNDEGILKLFGQ